MTPRQKTAYDLHQRGLSYAAIGKEMGVSRQTALEHVRKAHAFASNPLTGLSGLVEPAPLYAPAAPMGGYELPISVPARYAIDGAQTGGWTPSKLAMVIASALQLQDTATLFSLYREIEQKDLNYRSAKENRINQVLELPDVLTPVSDKLRDRKVAEFAERVAAHKGFQALKAAHMEGKFDGVNVAERIWGYEDGEIRVLDIEAVPARHLVFSKRDGRTVYLAPETHGGKPVELNLTRASVYYAKRTGLAVAGGLALVAAWAYVLKWLALRDWASISALWGKPIKVGRYTPGVGDDAISAMRSVLSQIGSEAAALIPKTMDIDLLKDGTITGSASISQDLVRYLDEQVTRCIEGSVLQSGTSTTGSGNSMALGKVHASNGVSILRADAKSLALTMQETIRIAVHEQFGPETPVPTYSLLLEEPEDVPAVVESAKGLHEIGFPLSVKDLAKRTGFKVADPSDPDDMLPAAAAPQPNDPANDEEDDQVDKPAKRTAANSACPVHGTRSFAKTGAGPARDGIDDLVDETLSSDDWETVIAATSEAILEEAAKSTDLDTLRELLAPFVETGDVEDLRLFLAQQKACARLAAAEGVDLTAPTSGARD